MEGILESFLTLKNIEKLIDSYIFIIVPMFNVEGVILGNFRCCPNGVDPNRLWN
jgi:hypothetical protein